MKILAIGAHPDDIEFGCAGTIATLKDEHSFFCLTVTDGGSRMRSEESINALSHCGVKYARILPFRDGYIQADKDTIAEIQDDIEFIAPDIVLTHYPNDSHQDHRAVAQIVKAAVRRRISLLYFDSYSSIGFSPNVYVNISAVEQNKRETILRHISQIEKYEGRGIDFVEYAISRNRNFGFESGCALAEGFCADGVMIR